MFHSRYLVNIDPFAFQMLHVRFDSISKSFVASIISHKPGILSNKHCSLLNDNYEPFQMQGRTFCCYRDALGEYRHICVLCFFQWAEICPVFHVFFSLQAHMKGRVFADGVIAPFEAEKWPQGSNSFFDPFLFCY